METSLRKLFQGLADARSTSAVWLSFAFAFPPTVFTDVVCFNIGASIRLMCAALAHDKGGCHDRPEMGNRCLYDSSLPVGLHQLPLAR